MSSKYELTVTEDYVEGWGIVEAVREIFQNALDNEIINPENKMFFEYTEDKGLLRIGNKTSCLSRESLLFGSSTKRKDSRTIGKHGEGYKLAFVILLREGKNVTVKNYGAKEVWRTRLVKSKRYGNTMLPCIFIDKCSIWNPAPSHDLMIEMEGITREEYESIVDSNLHLQNLEDTEILETASGNRVLLDEKYRGKIFVKGLYVANNGLFKCGYDFLPSVISLDRDRKLVDTFNLSWETSRVWREVSEKGKDICYNLVKEQSADTQYITDVYSGHSIAKSVCNKAYTEFVEEYGEKAVPVSSQEEVEKVERIGKKPIIVKESVKKLVQSSDNFVEINEEIANVKTIKEELHIWFEGVSDKLTEGEKDTFETLYAKLKD